MYPELFTVGEITIHSYGFLIMIGAFLGYMYVSIQAKKDLGIAPEKIQTLAILIILAAFIGGKMLFYLEKPEYYFNPLENMFKNFRTGFVFYGSLLFVIPTTVWYFRKQKWPVWPMLDKLSIAGCVIHLFGRFGCFFAGCCYGLPTEGSFGIRFTDHAAQAKPLNTLLHPTQLYSVFLIGSILVIVSMLKRRKRFEGQLFLVYIMLYALGRSVIEIFRGDVARGFVIDNVLSHSQFISIIVISFAISIYFYLSNQNQHKLTND